MNGNVSIWGIVETPLLRCYLALVMQLIRICVGVAAVLSWVDADAQIISIKQEGGKTITCMRSGLSSNLRDCGSKANWYTYVFVGSISSISPADKHEKEIQITPEEIFHGQPPPSLIVRTSQAACLPQLSVGERWLFFLREKKGSPIVLDYYGNDSVPIESAQARIETLRRLKTVGDAGLLRGSVQQGRFRKESPVAQAQVVLERFPDNLRFFASTDASGHYEFQPLPAGHYKISVTPVGSFGGDTSAIDIRAGSCWDLTLNRGPEGSIAGHVRRSDGTAAEDVPVVIVTESGYNTRATDKRGYFEFGSLDPEEYLVGIQLPGATAWKIASCGGDCKLPDGVFFYPGTPSRSEALTIKLAEDEKRKDVDFVIP